MNALPNRAPVALPTRRLVITLSLFAAASAVGGGIVLVAFRHGSPWLPPIEILEHTPFESLLAPGLVLAFVVGGTSLACAVLWWRRARGARDVALLAGGTLTLWIVAQVAMIRGFSWLHGLYGAVGLAILVLAGRAVLRSHEARPRWVALVTVAEMVGYLVPATTGILLWRAGAGEVTQTVAVVAAGLVEGLVLGTGQAFAFPFRVNRVRYAVLTSVAAALVWACVLSMQLLFDQPAVALGWKLVLGSVAGVVGLAAIGAAQWFELRRHAPLARRWILWTALAWALALPLSFAPGPFVDEATPLVSHLALWGVGGALMAYVMALVTWQGVRRLSRAASR